MARSPKRTQKGLVPTRPTRYALRVIAVLYVGLLVLLPLGTVLYRTFEGGVGAVWDALTEDDVIHAFQLTATVAGISVVINTVFGVGLALILARYRFVGKRLLGFFIDLPIALSPIVVGLALILVYGGNGWFGGTLQDAGIQIIFATPGMVLATVFVSLPLVLREVVPVLEEVGTDQEQAAQSLGAGPWQRFRRITFPSIKWAVAYGVVLSMARALGEFGAVKVVSGNLLNKTQTATLVVEQKYQDFEQPAAYAVAFALVSVAIVAIIVISILRPKENS